MPSLSEADPVHYSDWLALLGFMAEEVALQWIHPPSQASERTAEEWRPVIQAARQHVASIETRRSGDIRLEPLGPEHQDRIARLTAEPTFPEHLAGIASSSFAWVDIGSLRCFQPALNMDYVARIELEAPPVEAERELVAFCLPTKNEKPKTEVISGFNATTNTFFASTDNLDLRVVGNFQGEDPTTGRKLAGFAYDFGLPQISVVQYRGWTFLKNGYHRAYALYRKGHRKIPCIHLTTDSFQATGIQPTPLLPVDLLLSDRGPSLSDFSSPAAALVPKRRSRILVSVHAEVQVVPS